ncbi:MAG: 4-(cytidine 5'-diphospho)-2-C-methyl-D-erythritol kinase [Hyphomicrobiales bacterium]
MTAIRERAAAKINLALHVTGRRYDGYHLLDSVVVFADVGDVLEASPAAATSLSIDGPFGEGLQAETDNLVLRAARAMANASPRVPQAAFRLTKNLPVASGIGGGSADAAAAMRALATLAGIDPYTDEMTALALTLGADVPVCLKGRACRMSGIGERIEPWPGFAAVHAVLVNPGVPVSTPDVFRTLGLEKGAPAFDALPKRTGDVLDWLAACRNDLEAPAVKVQPVVGHTLAAIRATAGCRLARMSGSGATCFGLYDDAQQAAAAARALARPGWWAVPATLTDAPAA